MNKHNELITTDDYKEASFFYLMFLKGKNQRNVYFKIQIADEKKLESSIVMAGNNSNVMEERKVESQAPFKPLVCHVEWTKGGRSERGKIILKPSSILNNTDLFSYEEITETEVVEAGFCSDCLKYFKGLCKLQD